MEFKLDQLIEINLGHGHGIELVKIIDLPAGSYPFYCLERSVGAYYTMTKSKLESVLVSVLV